MNFFANGGSNGCGCNACDLVLLLLLLNGCGCQGCGGGNGVAGGCGCGMSSCDIVWLILILSCLCK